MTQRALTVRNVMLSEPVLVPPACPLRDVMEQMNRLRIGAVIVVNDGRELEGIFTERDLLKRVADADPGWRDLPVAAHPSADHLGVLIADASGHSIAAAMVAIMSRAAFADVCGTTTSPGAVLAEMNARLQGLADERFVTAFYGVLNRRTRAFTYAN